MSTMRRRSRGPRDGSGGSENPNSATLGPERSLIRTTTTASLVIFALTSALLIGLYLLSHNYPGSIPNSRFLGFETSPQQAESQDRFRLSPAAHLYRNASTFIHHWRVTSDSRRPDGVLKQIYLVNGLLPGPTLEVRSGDRLIIHVENALEIGQNVSIHWHGLSMRGANDMDGAAGITQDPILPGDTFVYDFVIDDDQHGTFWWHAHDGVQRADGLYGGLVVHRPAATRSEEIPDDEYLLLVGDWYHRSAVEALQFYMHPGAFGLETVPDSLLVNGLGVYNCADAVPARPVDCVQVMQNNLPRIALQGDTRSILRIVNVGAYAGFSASVPQARLKPLRVDGGHAVQGRTSRSVGFLHPGERIDVIVETDSAIDGEGESHLRITMDDQPFKYQNPALTPSHEYPLTFIGEHAAEKGSGSAVYEMSDVQDLQSHDVQHDLPPQLADHTIVLYTLTQKLASLENEPHGFINHTRWLPQSPPLIHLDREHWNEFQFIPLIKHNQGAPLWVDIVLNNLDEDSHPFHLHGYDFWVLTKYTSDYNWGSYDPFADAEPPGGAYNLVDPVKKDTVYVPRRGYAVLRFRADNPAGMTALTFGNEDMDRRFLRQWVI